jgi:molybdopterin/thiamine biosynthesis adenylyltransferase/rhodanese-related sulfurtransferase
LNEGLLTPTERRRYARHLTLPEVGEAGQIALKKSAVLIVGAGGLGSPAALYLAAAGVGRIGLVDFDNVDASNLHRQILYGTMSVGRPKLDAARARLFDLNPEITIETHAEKLTSANALEILRKYDIIVDGTDNFPTRYLVNDACVLLGRPNVYGSIYRFDGQASVFDAKRGPCYRCLYPDPPPPHLVPSCAEAGVLGVLPGVIGSIQATEAIKIITGSGEPLIGRLLLFDALQMSFRTLRLRKDPGCKVCGEGPTVTKLIDYEEFCSPGANMEITVRELAEQRESVTLIDVREQHEWNVGHLEGAKLIPLKQLPARMNEVPREADVVVYCAVGGRSAQAVHFLRQAGYERVRNLIGGIKAWAREVDPSVRVY